MAFDLHSLAEAVTAHGQAARVVVAAVRGSAPREAGAAMLVWKGGQAGTIGGGALEHAAGEGARALLGRGGAWRRSHRQVPLGPALGQCCGGSVRLLTEAFGAGEVEALQVLADAAPGLKRPLIGGARPLGDGAGAARLRGGWLSEPFAAAARPLWIYGAGHVGRALVRILPGLGLAVRWVDIAAARFPDDIPEGVTPLVAANPADAVCHAPAEARHLIVTHSHALDLDICHRLLGHGFAGAGLIGSATKWARFRKRLALLGHSEAQIARISCPIGEPGLGKSPEAIAVGVAAALLRESAGAEWPRQDSGGIAS